MGRLQDLYLNIVIIFIYKQYNLVVSMTIIDIWGDMAVIIAIENFDVQMYNIKN